MDATTVHDPNLDYLYLSDMIGPEHPMYEEMKRRYAKTPEGKRMEQFRAENIKYKDGLHIATHGKLDNFIRNENITYAGDPTDRIGKIRAIRMARSQKEDERVKHMTTEERKAYLEEADRLRIEQEKAGADRLKVDEKSVTARSAKRQAARTAFEEYKYKRDMERRASQERNRQFLKDDLARRVNKVNPVDARELAIKEREQKEKELADAAEQNDAAAKAEKDAAQKAPPKQTMVAMKKDTTITAPESTGQATKVQDAAGDRLNARREQLLAMQKPELEEIMKATGAKGGIGFTNEKRVDAILAVEFPVT